MVRLRSINKLSGTVAGEEIGINYHLNIVVELSRFDEPLFRV
jgi:hypothetical protein